MCWRLCANVSCLLISGCLPWLVKQCLSVPIAVLALLRAEQKARHKISWEVDVDTSRYVETLF